jgi:hypothetical protein
MRGELRLVRYMAASVLLALATGCGRSGEPLDRSRTGIDVPPSWSPVVAAPSGEWTGEEAELLNAALYLVETTLPSDDPRRALLRGASYVPLDRWSEVEGPRPEDIEAVFSMRTGRVYVRRPERANVLPLALTLAHELHHMERDRTESVNRMQEVDRERVAHAREAEDVGRMLTALREQGCDPSWLAPLELAQAKAPALAAMYSAKFELFRLVQAMDHVEGLREMPELFHLYRECIDVAESKLSTDHARELRLVDALASAVIGTGAADALSTALEVAREAIQECQPFESRVDELRSQSGVR